MAARQPPPAPGFNNDGIAGLLIILGSWVVGALVAVAELIAWLYTGEWPAWFTALVFRHGPEELTAWLLFPGSWRGLHKIVAGFVAFSLSGAVATLGTIIGAVLMVLRR